MNQTILLSPVLEVADKKHAFSGEDPRQTIWSDEISHWDPARALLLQAFNVTLIESIHETIVELLSLKVAESLFEYLEKVYSIKQDEVPSRLDKLLLELETTFGSRGAQVIGKAISKKLYSKLGLAFWDDPQGTLVTYVENAALAQHKEICVCAPLKAHAERESSDSILGSESKFGNANRELRKGLNST